MVGRWSVRANQVDRLQSRCGWRSQPASGALEFSDGNSLDVVNNEDAWAKERNALLYFDHISRRFSPGPTGYITAFTGAVQEGEMISRER